MVYPETYLELWQTSKIKLFLEKVNGFQPFTIFAKKTHPRCLTGFGIHFCSLFQEELFHGFYWFFYERKDIDEDVVEPRQS